MATSTPMPRMRCSLAMLLSKFSISTLSVISMSKAGARRVERPTAAATALCDFGWLA